MANPKLNLMQNRLRPGFLKTALKRLGSVLKRSSSNPILKALGLGVAAGVTFIAAFAAFVAGGAIIGGLACGAVGGLIQIFAGSAAAGLAWGAFGLGAVVGGVFGIITTIIPDNMVYEDKSPSNLAGRLIDKNESNFKPLSWLTAVATVVLVAAAGIGTAVRLTHEHKTSPVPQKSPAAVSLQDRSLSQPFALASLNQPQAAQTGMNRPAPQSAPGLAA